MRIRWQDETAVMHLGSRTSREQKSEALGMLQWLAKPGYLRSPQCEKEENLQLVHPSGAVTGHTIGRRVFLLVSLRLHIVQT